MKAQIKTTIVSILSIALAVGLIHCEKPGKPGEIRPVSFQSEGAKLKGNLHYPKNYDPARKYPALIVTGSWTTVKEQMAGLYAKELADRGFITLAFDFRNFGESEGEPRFFESPTAKIEDIKNAAGYLASNGAVDPDKIGAFAVCASAGYALDAAASDDRIAAVVTAAAWLHDGEAVKLFYGGEEGVAKRLAAARAAHEKYRTTGVVEYIPSISKTDDTAAMYGPFDYYLNPDRGAIPEWSADKFAVMSWEDWLTYNPMPSAARLEAPTLMIHADGAVLPDHAKQYFANIKTGDKKLHWISSGKQSPFEQFDFYDAPEKTKLSADLAAGWFQEKL